MLSCNVNNLAILKMCVLMQKSLVVLTVKLINFIDFSGLKANGTFVWKDKKAHVTQYLKANKAS
jgi:hypothetical protein